MQHVTLQWSPTTQLFVAKLRPHTTEKVVEKKTFLSSEVDFFLTRREKRRLFIYHFELIGMEKRAFGKKTFLRGSRQKRPFFGKRAIFSGCLLSHHNFKAGLNKWAGLTAEVKNEGSLEISGEKEHFLSSLRRERNLSDDKSMFSQGPRTHSHLVHKVNKYNGRYFIILTNILSRRTYFITSSNTRINFSEQRQMRSKMVQREPVWYCRFRVNYCLLGHCKLRMCGFKSLHAFFC